MVAGMEIRPLTDSYAVSPQIAPGDIAEIAAAGYQTIICNRPDAEIPPDLWADAVRAAAERAGLTFVENPVVHGALTEEIVAIQQRTLSTSKTLAYCASGTRSTIVWMLGAAPDTDPNALLAAAASQGYALEQLRPQLDALHIRAE